MRRWKIIPEWFCKLQEWVDEGQRDGGGGGKWEGQWTVGGKGWGRAAGKQKTSCRREMGNRRRGREEEESCGYGVQRVACSYPSSDTQNSAQPLLHTYTYIYTFIHDTYICMSIYIYTYIGIHIDIYNTHTRACIFFSHVSWAVLNAGHIMPMRLTFLAPPQPISFHKEAADWPPTTHLFSYGSFRLAVYCVIDTCPWGTISALLFHLGWKHSII